MTAIALDTHALVQRLQKAGFRKAQAEALTDAFKTTHEAQLEMLATKRDIAEMKHEIKELEMQLRREIAELKADLVKWLFGVAAGQIAIIVALLKLLP